MGNRKLYIDFSATKEFPECDYNFKLAVRRAVLCTLEYEDFDKDAEVSITLLVQPKLLLAQSPQ